MNERRIDNLIAECTSIYTDYNFEHGSSTVEYFDKEKFAELIINHATECVRDVLRDEDSELTYAAATQVQNRIKECFGVE
jgi:hypothetical protein